MGYLMPQCCIVTWRIAKALERRHLDDIERWIEESLVATMADDRPGVAEEGIRMRDPLNRIIHRFGIAVIPRRQILDLIGAENGVGLEEGNAALDLLPVRIRFGAREAAGIDHHRPGLALADMTTQLDALLERHPGWRDKTPRHGLRPEKQRIDPLIRETVMPERAGDPACRVRRAPGFDPGTHALFQVRDDAVGDFRVDIDAGFAFFPAHFPKPPFEAAPVAAVTRSARAGPQVREPADEQSERREMSQDGPQRSEGRRSRFAGRGPEQDQPS